MNFKKKLPLLIIAAVSNLASAQIINVPDTVPTGTTVNLATNVSGISYTWSIGNTDITPVVPPSLNTLMANGALSVPSFSCTANDNEHWYTFATNYGSGEIIRMDHGNSPTNTPTALSLGTFGMNSGQTGGIDIVKDQATGNWYGFIVDGTSLVRLEFGTSLANTPTSATMSFPNTLYWPHEFKIIQSAKGWVGFAANRSYGIARFDFNSGLSGTPTSVNLPLTNLASPVSFSLISQNNNWYLFVANLYPSGIARLDLGSNIQNNNPTSVLLGNFGQLNLTRKIVMLKDCDQVVGYACDEYSRLYKLDFNNDVTNTPTLNVLSSINFNSMELISYKNEIRAMVMNTNSNTFSTAAFQSFDPDKTFTNYYNTSQSYTFNTPGTYTINLAVDRGRFLDNRSYCKEITVGDFPPAPTAIAGIGNRQSSLSIYPNPAQNELNVIIPTTGKYSYFITNSIGQIVISDNLIEMQSSATLRLDLNRYNLNDGIYYFNLKNETGDRYIAKFLKGK